MIIPHLFWTAVIIANLDKWATLGLIALLKEKCWISLLYSAIVLNLHSTYFWISTSERWFYQLKRKLKNYIFHKNYPNIQIILFFLYSKSVVWFWHTADVCWWNSSACVFIFSVWVQSGLSSHLWLPSLSEYVISCSSTSVSWIFMCFFN